MARKYHLALWVMLAMHMASCGGNGTGSPQVYVPMKIQGLQVAGATDSSMVLTWDAPAIQSGGSPTVRYDLRYHQYEITAGNWDQAVTVPDLPAPQPAPAEEEVTALGLDDGTLYYFAAKYLDTDSNWSTLSNVAFAMTMGPGERALGGPRPNEGKCALATADGGMIIAGMSGTLSGNSYIPQFCVRKLDQAGDILWEKTYGSGTARCVIPATDGGYIIAGDAWLIKINESGILIWQKELGANAAYSVTAGVNGGYVVVGDIGGDVLGTDMYAAGTDASGQILWEKHYRGDIDDHVYGIARVPDGGYLLAGSSGYKLMDSVRGCGFLFKINAAGDSLWCRTFTGGNARGAYSIKPTSDGAYLLCGYEFTTGQGNRPLLIKCDAAGEFLWVRTYDVPDPATAYAFVGLPQGGYLVVGSCYQFVQWGYDRQGSSDDVYLFQVNASGDLLRQRSFGGMGEDIGYSIAPLSESRYAIVGKTSSFGYTRGRVYMIETDGL